MNLVKAQTKPRRSPVNRDSLTPPNLFFLTPNKALIRQGNAKNRSLFTEQFVAVQNPGAREDLRDARKN
jgi:hypothetical protein